MTGVQTCALPICVSDTSRLSDPPGSHSYNPSQLLNPMPWWMIHAAGRILCRILVRANVPLWLRDSAAKTTNSLDDVILDALATAIERMAEGYRSADQET